MPPDSETLCAISPALAEISAAITSALKVPEGFSCMRRIILGRGAFVTSIIMRHMCIRYCWLLQSTACGMLRKKSVFFVCFFTHGILPISSSIVISSIDGSQHAATGISMDLVAAGFEVSGTGKRTAHKGGWRAYGVVHRGVQ